MLSQEQGGACAPEPEHGDHSHLHVSGSMGCWRLGGTTLLVCVLVLGQLSHPASGRPHPCVRVQLLSRQQIKCGDGVGKAEHLIRWWL